MSRRARPRRFATTHGVLADDSDDAYDRLLARLTITDGLTRLYDARHLVEALDREIIRARRYDLPLSVLVLRVVLHDAGAEPVRRAHDVAWRMLARAVARRVPRDEIVARSRDDEITVLLPERAPEDVHALARELEGLSCSLPVALRATSATLSLADPAGAELLRRASDTST